MKTTCLGIVGCGQLGQMLGNAARRLGIEVIFLCLDETPVVVGIGDIYTAESAADFCTRATVITVERELFDDALLANRPEHVAIFPPYPALHTIRRRETQKAMLDSLGIPTAPWCFVPDRQYLAMALRERTGRWRLKRCLGGYDGLSQWRLNAPEGEIGSLPGTAFPAILEAEVDVQSEVSAVIARDRDGHLEAYPVTENHALGAILHWSVAPAGIPSTLADTLIAHAGRIADALGYVGVLAVEAFLTPDGLVINELAPRVHNSGHWTMDGTDCGQFEQHVRAVCGLPLRSPGPMAAVSGMFNILGAPPAALPLCPDVRSWMHLYGKTARPGRKLGHVNFAGPDRASVLSAIEAWRESR